MRKPRMLCRAVRLIRAAIATSLSTLREIFDESAYARFLLRNQMQASAETYRAFRSQNESLKARRPKCC